VSIFKNNEALFSFEIDEKEQKTDQHKEVK